MGYFFCSLANSDSSYILSHSPSPSPCSLFPSSTSFHLSLILLPLTAFHRLLPLQQMRITVALSALAAATLVSAGKFHLSTIGQGQSDILPNAYIVEYHEGISRFNAHANLKKHSIDYKVRNEYSIFNGAAISVKSNHDGATLATVPGVKNVWLVHLYSHPTVNPAKNNVNSTESTMSVHHMTGVDAVHKKLKLTGKGVKVGIIDTGIDYKHPAFAAPGATEGCFARYGKNCRIVHVWDFVGDAYTSLNTPVPDADPMDCNGHGTHVAGIVGGNGMNIKTGPKPMIPWIGVDPEVTFGAYRIFGCEGRTGTDIILAAMEMAFNDGMDVSFVFWLHFFFFERMIKKYFASHTYATKILFFLSLDYQHVVIRWSSV